MKSCFFTLFPHVSNRGTTAGPTCLSRLPSIHVLKQLFFYRTSPELLTFLVASNLKGRCSFPDHISKICFRYDNVCANIRGHNNCRRCQERYQQFSFQNELEIKFQMRLTHRSLNKNNQQDDRTMFSSLDGLRHFTSYAISSNVFFCVVQ